MTKRKGIAKSLNCRVAALMLIGVISFQGIFANGDVTAPLGLDAHNPHYFLFRGKPTVLVTSAEHYGAVLNLDFDYIPYLDELHACSLNNTRIWVGTYRELTNSFAGGIKDNTLAPKPNRFIAPWARSATPGYFDGGNKFDLTKWDDAFFKRLHDFMDQAARRGIVVELNLFCPNYDDALWKANPMNAANNVNGVGRCAWDEVYTLKNPDLVAVQEALVRKLAEEMRGYDNLYYEVCNEPVVGGVTMEWQKHIVDVLDATQEKFPPRHLISMNVTGGSEKVKDPHPAVSIFTFHYCTPPDAVAENYDLNKVIGNNESGFRGTGDATYRSEGWDFLLAGGAVYNNLDYSFTVEHPDGTQLPVQAPGGGSPALRRQLQVLVRFMESLNFVRMKPDNGVIKGGVAAGLTAHALAEPGKQYAVYIKREELGRMGVPPTLTKEEADAAAKPRQVALQIDLPAGEYGVEWWNPVTGKIDDKSMLKHPGGVATIHSPPFVEDVALKVTAGGS